MPSLNEFLKQFPELGTKEAAECAVEQGDNVMLDVVLLHVGEQDVQFGHLGAKFDVTRDDVLDVVTISKTIPNTFGTGVPCTIVLNTGAKLRRQDVIEATRLLQGLPFAAARPSFAPYINVPRHTAAEVRWMSANRMPPPGPHFAPGTYSDTQSPKWSGTNCDTYSDGWADDNNQDDGQSDEYYNDDSQLDD